MKRAYLGIGTNQGDRLDNLHQSLDLLLLNNAIKLEAVSSVYETVPIGGPPQGLYLNTCAQVHTELSPTILLKIMFTVEKQMGRVRKERWGPRIIDLDLLFYEGVFMNTPLLELPHPRMVERSFVLVPLNDIAPDLHLPGDDRSIRELIARHNYSAEVSHYRLADWYIPL